MMRSIKLFMRDFKANELSLLMITMFLIITCISSLTSFSQGIRTGLQETAASLLGGDLVITSKTPIENNIVELANHLKLNSSKAISFLSMLTNENSLALTEVKAVDHSYPLMGQIKTSSHLSSSLTESYYEGPISGTVWLEPRLFLLLNIKLNDIVSIGEASFKVTKVLNSLPDRGSQGLTLAPYALINILDVPKTQVIREGGGSRQTYSLLLKGKQIDIQHFKELVKPLLSQNQKLKSPQDIISVINKFFEQAQNYLYLILAINIILASLALKQCAKRFNRQQYNKVALLRCFGAKFETILLDYIIEIFLAGFIAAVLGFLVGQGIVFLTKGIFEKLANFEIAQVWIYPVMVSSLLFIVLLSFVIIPLYNLNQITALKLFSHHRLREESSLVTFKTQAKIKQYLLSFIMKLGISIRYGVSNLLRSFNDNILQLLAFSIVFGGFFLIFLLRNDLIQTWKLEIPHQAPNYFAINIDKQEVENFKQFFKIHEIPAEKLYPVIMGRLLAINNNENVPLYRSLNLTFEDKLPPDNTIIKGKWFTLNQTNLNTPEISIEQGFAERFNIHLNDKLKFLIFNNEITAIVSSIRKVEWDSFHPNFYVIFAPNSIENYSSNFITSFYLDKKRIHLLKDLIQQFPAVSIIDISSVLNEVLKMIDKLSLIVEYLWGFTCLLAIIFLLCIIAANLHERKQNALLFRTLGASNHRLLKIFMTEFIILGLLAGFIGLVLANIFYIWIAHTILGFTYKFSWSLIIWGPIFSIFIISLAGFMALRKVLQVAPIQILKNRG